MSKLLVLHYSMYGHTADLTRTQGRHVATISAEVLTGRRSLAAAADTRIAIGNEQ